MAARAARRRRVATGRTAVTYDALGHLQIAGLDDNHRPWHESVTGRGQEAWLLKQLYVERRFGRRNRKYQLKIEYWKSPLN